MLNIHREVEITIDEVIEACAPAGGRGQKRPLPLLGIFVSKLLLI
jgi:hypothetical protein